MLTLTQAISFFIARPESAKMKPHSLAGLDYATWWRARSGRTISVKNMRVMLWKAHALDKSIGEIRHGDTSVRIEDYKNPLPVQDRAVHERIVWRRHLALGELALRRNGEAITL